MCCGFETKVPARLIPLLIVALVVLAGMPRRALAQYNTAEISGVVTDVQGSVIPGASVGALHVASGLRTERVTDAQGRFFLPIPPGGSRGAALGQAGPSRTCTGSAAATTSTCSTASK